MRQTVQCSPSSGYRVVRLQRGAGTVPVRAKPNQSCMSPEHEVVTDRTQWGRLIRAIAAHQDRSAFAILFEHFAPRIKTFMQRSGLSEANAEELAQETMLVVWRKAALFDHASAGAAAWIFTIARNLRVDAHRRERRGGVIEVTGVGAEFQVDESPQPDSRVAAMQSEERVRLAVTQLSTDQVHVIELAFFEEKAHAEIARTLGIPLGTVKSRLRLAMARLRLLLGERP
jgi:RNA polymerase sigma-70 factor, ECF subfamily